MRFLVKSVDFIARLSDGTLTRYDMMSDNRNAYNDIKGLKYLGMGELYSADGIYQGFTERWHKETFNSSDAEASEAVAKLKQNFFFAFERSIDAK